MPDTKEWTLMFYFASDNPLAPGIVSQLKSIKNAGYHREVNVITYFDPQSPGTPTHVFDVNAICKRKNPGGKDIGFAASDFHVRDLREDRLWGKEKNRDEKSIRNLVLDQLNKIKGLEDYNPPRPPSFTDADSKSADLSNPAKSLETFLDFCARHYKANHYMLFILGHGLVVGDDVFLFDEHATEHSVTLRELGRAITGFKKKIGKAEFELVSFHSCSMSSLEVAFELQGTANYMLASQGPAFVGSWPYRQILIRVFKDAEKEWTADAVEALLRDIFNDVYLNSIDYLLAGYSFDLCLCELRKSKIRSLAKPIKTLADVLVKRLKEANNTFLRELLVLAHWQSQSFWQENYTDLFDFCFCLERYCHQLESLGGKSYQDVLDACKEVMNGLMEQDSNDPKSVIHPDNPVIRAGFVGPDSQYSHGLSVFFPWTRPSADRTIMKQYKGGKKEYEFYKFNRTSWFNFLQQYWGPEGLDENIKASTMREPRKDEEARNGSRVKVSPEEELQEDIVSLMFNASGRLSINGALSGGDKVNPPDPTGDDCNCGSIKNYRRDTRSRRERIQSVKGYPLSRKKLRKLT